MHGNTEPQTPLQVPTNQPSNGGTNGKPGNHRSPPWKKARQEFRQAQADKRQARALSQDVKTPAQQAATESRKRQKEQAKAERLANYKHLEDLRNIAVKMGIVEHGLRPEEVLQRIIDDAFLEYLVEQQRNREAQNSGQQTSTAKERSLRKEAAYFASLAIQYGIADRQTRVQETRLQLMTNLLQAALRHPDIDLPPDKVKMIPQLMRQSLQEMRQNNERRTPSLPQ